MVFPQHLTARLPLTAGGLPRLEGGEVVVGEDTDPQLEFAAAGGGERGEIRSEHRLPVPIGVMQIFFFLGGDFFLPRVNGGFDKRERRTRRRHRGRG